MLNMLKINNSRKTLKVQKNYLVLLRNLIIKMKLMRQA